MGRTSGTAVGSWSPRISSPRSWPARGTALCVASVSAPSPSRWPVEPWLTSLFRQIVTVGSVGDPLVDALDALGTDERQGALVSWIGDLAPSDLAELRVEVERQAEGLVRRWPPLDPSGSPHPGADTGHRWPGERSSRLRVDRRSGPPRTTVGRHRRAEVRGRRPSHRDDLRFDELVEALRSPAPPFAVATDYARTGEVDVESVTHEVLVEAARRCLHRDPGPGRCAVRGPTTGAWRSACSVSARGGIFGPRRGPSGGAGRNHGGALPRGQAARRPGFGRPRRGWWPHRSTIWVGAVERVRVRASRQVSPTLLRGCRGGGPLEVGTALSPSGALPPGTPWAFPTSRSFGSRCSYVARSAWRSCGPVRRDGTGARRPPGTLWSTVPWRSGAGWGRTVHWEPWVAGLSLGGPVRGPGDAVTWATPLWAAFDWPELPGREGGVGGADDRWSCPGGRTRHLQGSERGACSPWRVLRHRLSLVSVASGRPGDGWRDELAYGGPGGRPVRCRSGRHRRGWSACGPTWGFRLAVEVDEAVLSGAVDRVVDAMAVTRPTWRSRRFGDRGGLTGRPWTPVGVVAPAVRPGRPSEEGFGRPGVGLSRRRQGDLVDQEELARAPCIRPHAPGSARSGREVHVRRHRREADDRRHLLAEALVGDTDHDGVVDAGMGLHRRLDLLGEDLLASGVDRRRAPAVHGDDPVGLDRRQVPGTDQRTPRESVGKVAAVLASSL